ncbi:MAG: HAD-IIIC family phosphatase [Alphaproteobacteria bacterium]|nr:HAD-IIIC family phosphatase [Alphaproteobacteria bacterium]
MTAPDPKTAWRQYQKQAGTPDITVGLAASFTIDPLEPYLGAHLLGKKLHPEFSQAPFNQLQQLCLNHTYAVGDPDVIVLLWRIEDLFGAKLAATLDAADALPALLDDIRQFAASIAQLRRNFAGTLIVSTPPFPSLPGFSALELAAPAMQVYTSAAQTWAQETAKIDRLRVLDLQALMMEHGAQQANDARKWQLYRQPYSETFWQAIGTQAGRIIAAEKIAPKKCVILDLDNTLWGGVIGEDGLGGIALGDEFPGRAFRDFQRYLMHLKSKGVMLAVASKNNPEDAYEVFDKHDAMVLSRRDIVAFEINWESKVDSIKRIAAKLNIGLDALVFVDDNPKETGEVQERLPAVTCILVPEELADLPALLSETDLFDTLQITDEDRKRTEMMAADQQRSAVQETMSEEDFRKSLQLKIDIFAAEKQHLARITQLVNKTNQFNLTTIRRTQDEIEQLAASQDSLVLGMTIADKYGDYGLVGVAILSKNGTTADIDTLLMSCRVLGRGAEETFIAQLAAAAASLGCTGLRGKYIATAKNDMVKDLYARFKFATDGDGWILKTADAAGIPAHIDASLRLPQSPIPDKNKEGKK